MNCAYCTLVSNDEYTWGAICLAISKNRTAAKYPLVILVSEDVSEHNRRLLSDYGIVKMIPNHKFEDGYFEGYLCTKQKLEVFNLIEYDRVMFLDADVIMLDDFDFELDNNTFLFDIRSRYTDINKVCGEMFIVSPNEKLFNLLMKLSAELGLEDDEQCLAYIYRERYLIPLNGKEYSPFFTKAIHFCDANELLLDIDAPNYSYYNKYWQHYDMNETMAENLVVAIVNRCC